MTKILHTAAVIVSLSIIIVIIHLKTLSPLDLACGFTTDFQQFLNQKGYSNWTFDRPDLKCAAFGGKIDKKQSISKVPIIFIHGNSDVAFGRGEIDGYLSWQTGFRDLATYLGQQGYKKGELYTTTWGPADAGQAYQNNHKQQYTLRLRAFLEAVLEYTNSTHVNVIGHSMGVTLARKIIKGGKAIDQNVGEYNIGVSLSNRVLNFIGLAGANLGLNLCISQDSYPTCSKIDGFYPGSTSTEGPSQYFKELNQNPQKQGERVYSIWSKFDDLIGNQCVVWGKITSRIPQQKDQVIKTTAEWNHFAVRDNSGPDLIKWL